MHAEDMLPAMGVPLLRTVFSNGYIQRECDISFKISNEALTYVWCVTYNSNLIPDGTA